MRIAAVYHKQLGDTLLLQPALAHLAALSGGSVTLFTQMAHKPLVDLMPGVVMGDPAHPGPAFDRIIAFDPSSRSTLGALRIGARIRQLVTRASVYIRWHHRWLFHDCLSQTMCDGYVARYYFDLVGGKAGAFTPPRLNTPPSSWVHSPDTSPPALVINPVSAWSAKSWTVAGWQEVIRDLITSLPGPVAVLGSSQDWQVALCRDICAPFHPEAVLNLAGQTSLPQFISLLARTPLTLTVDGAASHIAQAFGNATLTLFGPTKPLLWHHPAPLNRFIHASEFAPEALPPVSQIPSARVRSEARILLDKVSRFPSLQP